MDLTPTLQPPTRPTSIAIACLTTGHPSLETVEAITRASQLPIVTHHFYISSGPYLDDGRNELIATFLDQCDASHLLMVDDDIDFTGADVAAISAYASTHHAISGQYPNFDGTAGLIICAYHLTSDADPTIRPAFDDGKSFHPIPLADAPYDPIEVDSAGTGFMLISRALFVEMAQCFPPPMRWFQEPIIAGWDDAHVHLGEDHGFALRLKALNIPLLLAPVRVTHLKRARFKVPEPGESSGV